MKIPAKILCPFTGKEIQLRKVGLGHWMGIVEGGYTTRLFDTKAALVAFLLTRNGVTPELPEEPVVTLSAASRKDELAEYEKSRTQELNDAVEDYVDRVSTRSR